LRALASDPTMARRMGAAGRARVDEFAVERMVEALAELYSSLSEKGGSP